MFLEESYRGVDIGPADKTTKFLTFGSEGDQHWNAVDTETRSQALVGIRLPLDLHRKEALVDESGVLLHGKYGDLETLAETTLGVGEEKKDWKILMSLFPEILIRGMPLH